MFILFIPGIPGTLRLAVYAYVKRMHAGILR